MRPPEQRILIEGYEVRCSIGVLPAERNGPQRVRVSVALDVRPGDGCDDIAGVLDYDVVRAGIARVARSRHFNLLETLCEEIARLCLSHDQVRGVRARTEKLDVYPDCQSVGVEVVRFKE
jgi:dihydroneopterin aldolase